MAGRTQKRRAYEKYIVRAVKIEGYVQEIEAKHDHLLLHFTPEQLSKGV